MADDPMVVMASAERDPDGAKLAAALNAQLDWDRAQRTRSRWVHVLAALGLPVWVLCLFPGCLSHETRRLVLIAWAFSALAAASALALEWRQRCKRDLSVLDIRGVQRPGL